MCVMLLGSNKGVVKMKEKQDFLFHTINLTPDEQGVAFTLLHKVGVENMKIAGEEVKESTIPTFRHKKYLFSVDRNKMVITAWLNLNVWRKD